MTKAAEKLILAICEELQLKPGETLVIRKTSKGSVHIKIEGRQHEDSAIT